MAHKHSRRDKSTASQPVPRSRVSQERRRRQRAPRRWLAAIAGAVVILLALIAVLAEFVAPYGPVGQDELRAYRPPTRIHWSQQGRLTQPFVYGVSAQRNAQTQMIEYREDASRVYPVYILCHGEPYRLWGLFPSDVHLFGLGVTEEALLLWGGDGRGHDLFSRIVFAARASLSIGLLSALLSAILAGLLGGLAGCLGGLVDAIVRWTIGFLRLLPALPIWMALAAALPRDWPPSWSYVAIAVILSLTGWVSLARAVRWRILSLRRADFALAARLDGRSALYVIWRHLARPPRAHIVAALMRVSAQMLLGETALSLLGLGLRSPMVSWGVLLQDALDVRAVVLAPWLLIPGLAVMLAVLALGLLGETLCAVGSCSPTDVRQDGAVRLAEESQE